jgi:hypothetical protein
MNKIMRLLALAGIILILSMAWRTIEYAQEALLWTFLIYLIVGSFTGGTRIAVGRFTGKPIGPVRSKLGISWANLTIWLLRLAFGITPKDPPKDDPSS